MLDMVLHYSYNNRITWLDHMTHTTYHVMSVDGHLLASSGPQRNAVNTTWGMFDHVIQLLCNE